jgi:hypothetical protein
VTTRYTIDDPWMVKNWLNVSSPITCMPGETSSVRTSRIKTPAAARKNVDVAAIRIAMLLWSVLANHARTPRVGAG